MPRVGARASLRSRLAKVEEDERSWRLENSRLEAREVVSRLADEVGLASPKGVEVTSRIFLRH